MRIFRVLVCTSENTKSFDGGVAYKCEEKRNGERSFRSTTKRDVHVARFTSYSDETLPDLQVFLCEWGVWVTQEGLRLSFAKQEAGAVDVKESQGMKTGDMAASG